MVVLTGVPGADHSHFKKRTVKIEKLKTFPAKTLAQKSSELTGGGFLWRFGLMVSEELELEGAVGADLLGARAGGVRVVFLGGPRDGRDAVPRAVGHAASGARCRAECRPASVVACPPYR